MIGMEGGGEMRKEESEEGGDVDLVSQHTITTQMKLASKSRRCSRRLHYGRCSGAATD